MSEINPADVPDIGAVVQQFEAWREGRTRRREPIPDQLWQAAADLCRNHSITRVSQSLRLSFSELKKRVVPVASSRPQFLAIDSSCLVGNWRIECDRPDGARLRISGTGPSPEVDALLTRFLS